MTKNIARLAFGALFFCASVFAQQPGAKEDSESAHLELAASYFEAGRPDVAVEELQKVLAKNPQSSPANNLMGVVYMKAGNLDQAEKYLSSALAADPQSGNARNNYGQLLCKTGRYDAGMESFAKALQSPKFTQIPQALVNGGICLQQKGDMPAAEKFLLKALEQEPFMPAALYQLAKVYLAMGRLPQAESRLAALHKQAQPNAASLMLARQLALAQGKPDEAQAFAALLASRFPASAEAQQISQSHH